MTRSAVLALFLVTGLGRADEIVPLPACKGLDLSLGEALARRHSTRGFDASRELSREQLAALLWAAVGINRPDPEHPGGGKRTSPSAFGAGSIDILVTSREGTFLYSGRDHALVRRSSDDLREKLAGAGWAREAPLVLLAVASLGRYPERVPPDERRLYAHADAAVAGENLYLAATALGLGTVLTVSSNPRAGEILGLEKDQTVVFVFPVGHEKTD